MNSKHLLAAFGIASALLVAAVPGTSFGAENPPAAKTEAKTGVVSVKGKDYSFTVRTPEGWQADTETAKQYHGDVLFTQKGDAGGGAKVLLIVQHKFDENTALLIQGDINNIRKQFPNLELADLDVKHPKYPTFTKTLSQPGQFFQYEAYMNPGSMYPNALYAGMSKAKDPATPAELAAYQEIVQSLEMAPLPPAALNPG
ncbi:MAG TPA: hypothetical protein VGM86_35690 [Thermoanaerobaculia bacterium]|jgi:hypothetical protein